MAMRRAMEIDAPALRLTIRNLSLTTANAVLRVRVGDIAGTELLLREVQRLVLVCERECEIADSLRTRPSEGHDG